MCDSFATFVGVAAKVWIALGVGFVSGVVICLSAITAPEMEDHTERGRVSSDD